MMRPLILGGGLAGAAAAMTLARGGQTPLLLERSRETGDALCGGFLSWRTLETLSALGVEADTLSSARVTRVRLFAGDRIAESPLPRPALAVSRRRLDTVLLAAAVEAGAQVERGAHVRGIDQGSALVDGSRVAGGALLLATGKHDLRGLPRPVEPDPTLGLRVRLDSSGALTRLVGDAVELHLFDGGYAGIALHEDGSANVCLAVRGSRLRGAGSPAALLAELASGRLGERLAAIDPATPIDAVANVPYGWRDRDGTAGVYRLGDQAAVIPSLAGEGMGIALASGVSAARAVLVGEDPIAWQRRFARRAARSIAVADTLRAAMEQPRTALPLVAIARLAPGLVGWVGAATRLARG